MNLTITVIWLWTISSIRMYNEVIMNNEKASESLGNVFEVPKKEWEDLTSNIYDIKERTVDFFEEMFHSTNKFYNNAISSWTKYYTQRISNLQTTVDLLIKLVSIVAGVISLLIIIRTEEIILYRNEILTVCIIFEGAFASLIGIIEFKISKLDVEFKSVIKECETNRKDALLEMLKVKKENIQEDISSLKIKMENFGDKYIK